MAIAVNESACIGCGTCAQFCPLEAMEIPPEFVVKIDPKKCNECLECLFFCPVEALKEV
ncbi:MAG: 4Fe-4S binding protein [Chloroflexota bacterium]